ncbi:MAG: LolA family protein [bacterium]
MHNVEQDFRSEKINANALPHSALVKIFCLIIVSLVLAQKSDTWLRLYNRYLGLKSLSGSFIETIEPESGAGQTPIIFKGRFSFQLPNRFRLEVSEPVSQVIVGNDSVVWFYFPDEKRAVLQTSHQPIALLAFIQPILDTTATVIEEERGVISVMTGSGSLLNNLRLELNETGTLIEAFSFIDEWGNHCRFVLKKQRWNPSLPAKLFRFRPPAGTTIEYQ